LWLALGYPYHYAENTVLSNYGAVSPVDTFSAVCTRADIGEASDLVTKITVSEPIKDYIINIADATRKSERLRLGVSPRATLALMKASQAFAAILGRDYVLPDDVKRVAVPVLSHRIITRSQNTIRLTDTNEQVIEAIIDTVRAPID
jgi:MoxR-like ATPase